MSIGLTPTKASIDATSGTIAVSFDDLFAKVDRFQTFLLATPDATLTSAPYSYSAGEVAQLKSAFTDLAQLAAIYRNQQNLASAKDFRAFSKLLIGFGL